MLILTLTGAANGLFGVRIAPLQKAKPGAAVDFLYRLRMVSILP
jgi:hypothetical protein